MITVVAPPGYGKTTLTAQHVDHDARPSAWLSITDDCNDPTTLARSLVLTLSLIIPIDEALLQELTAKHASWPAIIAGCCASIRNAPSPYLLVVDDVHVLTDQGCVDLLIALADETRPGSQLVMAARSLASVPLAKLRVPEDFLEIGAEDLRFNVDDAASLLRNTGVVDMSEEDVAALTEQTEGWAIGLNLAALSRVAGVGANTAPRFGGDDRFLADYLRENVLARLQEDDVDFLVRTSILDEMTGPLCDATLETTGSGARLEALEASNLLVVPLDHQRERFRYHHLFRDLLRMELEHRSPELVPGLTARASAWCEAQGAYDLAITYAQAGHLTDRVAELLGRYAHMAYFTGRANATLRWLTWLDDHASVGDYPLVAALGGWTMAMEGREFDARRWADAAADSERARSDEAEGCRLLLQAAMCRDGAGSMLDDVDRALTILPPLSRWVPSAMLLHGLAEVLDGNAVAAEESFRLGVERSTEMGTAPAWSMTLAELAALALARGDVEEAAGYAGQARAVLDEVQLDGYSMSVLTYAVAARVAIIQGDPVHAKRFAQKAADHRSMLTVAVPILAVQVRILLLWCAVALFDVEEAEMYLTEAANIVRDCSDLGALADELETARNQIELLRRSRPGIQPLSPAEARVLPLLTTNLSFREIGEQLYVSQHTVKTQAIAIYRKLGVTSRGSAVDMAREVGLLP